MKIKVKGYVWENNAIVDFEDVYVTLTDDAAGIHGLRELLEADGVRICSMINLETNERYYTEGEVVAMGHSAALTGDKYIYVYVSDGIFVHFSHIMR